MSLTVAVALSIPRTVAAQRHETAQHLLGGSFRGSALRGLLPERILNGTEQPEAQATGDFDARGGPEIAVTWKERDSLVLALLRQNEGGAWKRLAEVRRDFPGVDKLEFVSFEHGAPQALVAQWFIGGSVKMGQLEVFGYRRGTDVFESILATAASSYRSEDIDDDQMPELVAYRDSDDVKGVPEVFKWDGYRLVAPIHNLRRFFEKTAKQFSSDGEALVRQTPRGQSPSLVALDDLLNSAKCLEQAGQKSEAFRAYRRVASLGRSGLIRPRKNEPAQQFRDMRTEEAREGMARLLGKSIPPKRVLVPPPKPPAPPPMAALPAATTTASAAVAVAPQLHTTATVAPPPVKSVNTTPSTSAAAPAKATTAPPPPPAASPPQSGEPSPAPGAAPLPAPPNSASPPAPSGALPPPPGEALPPPPGQ